MLHKVPSVAALHLKRYNGYGDSVHKLDCVRSCVRSIFEKKKMNKKKMKKNMIKIAHKFKSVCGHTKF
jgi:hypothetical protein